MRPFPPPSDSDKLDHSAPLSPSDGPALPGPDVPITSGPSSFRRRYLVAWLGIFAFIWLAGFSGCTMLDI